MRNVRRNWVSSEQQSIYRMFKKYAIALLSGDETNIEKLEAAVH